MPVAVIRPTPAGARATVKLDWGTKVAVTARSADMVSWQVDVPLHAPDQPVKRYPSAGSAVSVTRAPASKVSLQSAPQSMPVPPTEPPPLGDRLTVRVCCAMKVAVTLR